MGDPIQSPLRAMLIVVGAALLLAGIAWPFVSRWFGRLPGDLVVKRDGFTFAFPIVTCLILSAVLSLLLWLFRR